MEDIFYDDQVGDLNVNIKFFEDNLNIKVKVISKLDRSIKNFEFESVYIIPKELILDIQPILNFFYKHFKNEIHIKNYSPQLLSIMDFDEEFPFKPMRVERNIQEMKITTEIMKVDFTERIRDIITKYLESSERDVLDDIKLLKYDIQAKDRADSLSEKLESSISILPKSDESKKRKI